MLYNDVLDYFGNEDYYYRGKIIPVRYFYAESEALLYAAQLRASGIQCFVSNTNTITAFPLGNAGIGLHIKESDRRYATEVIRELDHNNLNGSFNLSFHEADHEDIEYEKSINRPSTIREPVLILYLIIITFFLLYRYYN